MPRGQYNETAVNFCSTDIPKETMTMRSVLPILNKAPYAFNLGTLIRSTLPSFSCHYMVDGEKGFLREPKPKLFRGL